MTEHAALQWKVVPGVHISDLARELDSLEAKGWGVFQIIGPQGNLAIVACRTLSLTGKRRSKR